VTSAFERVVPHDANAATERIDPTTKAFAWEERYVAPARAGGSLDPASAEEDAGVLTLKATVALDDVTVERVDPHGATLSTAALTARPYEPVVVTFTPKAGASGAPSVRFLRLRYKDGTMREIRLWVTGDKTVGLGG
jgi:hypothetical protein